MPITMQEVFEKYKHLDHLLSDEKWLCLGEPDFREHILYDCWQAIKGSVCKYEPAGTPYDRI